MGKERKELKILIVGASGLLGHELAIEAKKNGHELFLLTRGHETIVENAQHIRCDLRELKFETLPNVDVVYYLAQSKSFRDFPNSWEDIFDINVKIPLQMMDWARKIGVKQFHLASSGGIYQGGIKAVEESNTINVNREIGFYLSSRLSCEAMAKNFSNFFEVATILRPFFIYGKRQNRSMLIPRLVDSVKEGKPILLNGEFGIRINPIHVSDAAAVSLALLKTKGFGIYNIAGEETLSLRDICLQISTRIGKEAKYQIVTTHADDLIADNSKIKEIYDLEMKRFSHVLDEML